MNVANIAGALLLCALIALPARAQQTKSTQSESDAAAPTKSEAPADSGKKLEGETSGNVKPYNATIQIDTTGSIVYGDDIVATIRLAPTAGIEVKEVRIAPKGRISNLYPPRASTEPQEEGKQGESGEPKENSAPEEKIVPEGTVCRTSSLGGQPGMPVIASCRLTAPASMPFNLLPATMQGSGRHQFEVAVTLFTGADSEDVVTYYEFGSAEFASPLTTVVLGAILGAGLWALFLPMSTPFPSLPPDATDTWENLLLRVKQSLPQILLRWSSFALTFLRSTVLGGVTALVLIILARTTEGLDTPIAFQINDVWGGLLVGIFSTPLAKWVKQKVETMFQ